MADLKSIDVSEELWYAITQDRSPLKSVCRDGLAQGEDNQDGLACAANRSNNRDGVYPYPCGRPFRRQGDLTSHSHTCNGPSLQDHKGMNRTDEYICQCGRSLKET